MTRKFTSRRFPRRKDFSWSTRRAGIAQHYHCTREDLSTAEVVEVFRDYLAGDIFWKRRFEFECRDLRTPWYRAGFFLGQLFRKVAEFAGIR